MKKIFFLLLTLSGFTSFSTFAQSDEGQIHGNFAITGQYYQQDTAISAAMPDEKVALQGFGNLLYTKGKFSAGVRFESYLPALEGYPAGNAWTGAGIGYRFARYNDDKIEITVGNFYEQFGTGMVLRTWEDNGLGVDYSLDGIRVKARPYKGVALTGLYGRQRDFFDNGIQYSPGIVRGFDAEFDLGLLLDSVIDLNSQIIVGGSFVSKYQNNTNSTFNFPENVGSGSVRARFIKGGLQLSGEYARISENPSMFNSNIADIPDSLNPSVGLFQIGQGVNLNATYSRRGFGVSATASSLGNMAFQSDRNAGPFNSWINYLPATSVLQTYLLAQLYPYATQPNGEVAYRGDLFYTIPKGSFLGGKYGLKIDLSYTRIMAPDTTELRDFSTTRDGVDIALFRTRDELYYSDFNVKLTKKLSSKFKASLFYMNLVYNNNVSQGAYNYSDQAVSGTVYADLYVFEGSWRIKRGHNLRFELQALRTNQHLQDWATVVMEYTVSPNWFFSVLDQYNYGNDEGKDYHFPVVATGFIKNSNRISVSYGRQRAGVFCVGGVCRVVPASNGLTLTLTSSF